MKRKRLADRPGWIIGVIRELFEEIEREKVVHLKANYLQVLNFRMSNPFLQPER